MTTTIQTIARTIALTAAVAVHGTAQVQAADPMVDFYKGKQVTLQIGSEPGGGYDLVGRLVARHMHRHIPGNPGIIVQNVPGGGSLRLANQLYNVAPRDGLLFALLSTGAGTNPLLAPDATHFEPTKFNWLGSTSTEAHVLVVWHTAPVQTFAETFTKEMIMGASSPGAAPYDYPFVTNALLGTKFKIITGYVGAGPILSLMMPREEVHALAGHAWGSMRAGTGRALLDEGKVKILATFGTAHPELANVPSYGYGTTEEQRQMFEILYARQKYGRPFVTPPGVPEAQVQALKRALEDTMRDPAFLAEAEKTNVEVHPIPGEELKAMTDRLYSYPDTVLVKLRSLLNVK